MAEEEVLAPSSPPLHTDHKRKHDELELPVEVPLPEDEKPGVTSDVVEGMEEIEGGGEDGDSQEAKRARVEDKLLDEPVSQNGFEIGKPDEDADEESGKKSELLEESGAQPALGSSRETEEQNEEKVVNEEATAAAAAAVDEETDGKKADSAGDVGAVEGEEQRPKGEEEQPLQEADDEALYDGQTTFRRMEVPNDKVGVLIGKGGDSIRFLQYSSGAKIQITKDTDADPHCVTRPVEIIGTLGSISKAEKLIQAVIAEGSPSLVARGHRSTQTAAVAEQLEMQVPNEKVGLIIGKGGDTIKALQAKTGARIQLIPQHLPEGDGSKERTVRVTGDRKQIDLAQEMIKEVTSQNVKQSSSRSGSFNQQQSYRSRGTAGPNHWGPPRGPHQTQPMPPYDYHQRGPPYQPQHGMHYPPPNYGNYAPQQHMGQRTSYGPGWEQRPPPNMPPSGGGGYDYYGGQRGYKSEHPAAPPVSNHPPGPAPATNYGYGHDYGHQPSYPQPVPPQQSYGHGYDEPKYGHASSQPGYPGYPAHYQQYNKQQPPAYPMQAQAQPPQPYSQQSQPYGQGTATAQQQYPYQSGYPPYGTATDGYAQAPAQQSGQPVPAYGQTAPIAYGSYQSSQGYPDQAAASNAAATGYGYQAQDPSQPVYAQQAPATAAASNAAATGYGYQAQDPSQQVYAQQVPATAAASNAAAIGYGYQAQAPSQQVYAQQAPAAAAAAPAQPSYDQSVAQPGSYAAAPVVAAAPGSAAQVGYGKTVSPQPAAYGQYDSTKMYAAIH